MNEALATVAAVSVLYSVGYAYAVYSQAVENKSRLDDPLSVMRNPNLFNDRLSAAILGHTFWSRLLSPSSDHSACLGYVFRKVVNCHVFRFHSRQGNQNEGCGEALVVRLGIFRQVRSLPIGGKLR